MRLLWNRVFSVPRNESGAALITTIGIIAVLTILSVAVADLSLNNLRNATRDKQSNSALATSEAGVAEAIEFIRSGRIGLSALNCPEPAPGVDEAEPEEQPDRLPCVRR